MSGEPVSGEAMSVASVPVFDGVRVVELAQFLFVPVAGALLADWGADVVKIQHPVSGDGYRGLVSQGCLECQRPRSSPVETARSCGSRGASDPVPGIR